MNNPISVIISGGGTGGHIFPAIAIANAIRKLEPEARILFVGAKGRMEMTRVPEAGYEIIGLPIEGFDRKHLLKNIVVLWKILKSELMARRIVKKFNPDVAVGVGGYASGPLLRMAGKMGIPTVIQEQNSYAGVTNKLLAQKADRICVAYEGMERFFPKEKILLTGNPVRENMLHQDLTKEEALKTMVLDPAKKTILLTGGSLGARTLNQAFISRIQDIAEKKDINFIWQTGRIYIDDIRKKLETLTGKSAEDFKKKPMDNLYVSDFLSNMGIAYKAADLIISRAGASTISELCLLGKAAILVPSPNVAEDHQTKNALALSEKGAAVLLKDMDAIDELLPKACELVQDTQKLEDLRKNILLLALPQADAIIAKQVIQTARTKKK